MRLIPLIFSFTVFCACSSGTGIPSNVLPPSKMQLVIFDLLRADELVNNFMLKDTSLNRNTETKKMYQQVFLIHNITKEQFYKSYNFYQGHPDKNKILIDSLTAFGNRKRYVAPPSVSKRPDSIKLHQR